MKSRVGSLISFIHILPLKMLDTDALKKEPMFIKRPKIIS